MLWKRNQILVSLLFRQKRTVVTLRKVGSSLGYPNLTLILYFWTLVKLLKKVAHEKLLLKLHHYGIRGDGDPKMRKGLLFA